ncbi:MAG TPA: L,D-transpeptidase, partial [Gemmatimonadaceae bacterium]|nr:L,D-transpeptidase [Gemmatimonadaceae bacterium]
MGSAAALALLALATACSLGMAQQTTRGSSSDSGQVLDSASVASSARALADSIARAIPLVPVYRSRGDSIASVRARAAARHDERLHIVVSLNNRRLYAIAGSDTLLRTSVAVSTDETLKYGGKSWRFVTPRGVRTVIAKKENPVWIPPEWHYAEVAREEGLKLGVMTASKTMLSDGRWLEMRNGEVGVVDRAG